MANANEYSEKLDAMMRNEQKDQAISSLLTGTAYPGQSISAQNAAKNSLAGSIFTGSPLNMAQVPQQISTAPIFDANISVTPAQNGYVLTIAKNYGGLKDIFVATTLNEVRDLILAQMAVAQLEK